MWAAEYDASRPDERQNLTVQESFKARTSPAYPRAPTVSPLCARLCAARPPARTSPLVRGEFSAAGVPRESPTRTHTYAHTHTHARTHAHTHTHKHAHTRTHARTRAHPRERTDRCCTATLDGAAGRTGTAGSERGSTSSASTRASRPSIASQSRARFAPPPPPPHAVPRVCV